MAKIADFFVELGLKKDKYDKGMAQAGKEPTKMGKLFAKMGTAIAAGFAVAAAAAVAFIGKSIALYDAQIKAEQSLLKALNGRVFAQQALIKQAGVLQRTTLFGDEETIGAQKLLAVMGLSALQIADIIPLVQDYSTAMGMDLNSAAKLVGKTIVTGTNALERQGIVLAETTTKAEKFEEVVKKLNSAVGGQSAAAAKVGISGIQQLKGAWSDMMEVVGAEWGPFLAALATIAKNKMLDSMTPKPSEAQKKINEFVEANAEGRAKILKDLKEYEDISFKLMKEWQDKDNQEKFEHYLKQWGMAKDAHDDILKLIEEGAGKTVLTAEEIKAAEEAKYNAWLKTNEAIREQNELAEINGEVMRKSLQGAIADMKALTKAANDKAEAWKTAMSQVFAPDEEGNIDDGTDAITSKYFAIQERTQSFIADMNQMTSDFIADFIGGMAEGIGLLLTGDIGFDTFFNMVLGSFGSFMKQMGALMIAYGVAQTAFWSSMAEGPLGAVKLIAAGVAMVAIGAAISSLGKNPGKAMGGGGGGSTAGMAGGGGGYQNQVTGYGNQGGFGYTLDTKISGDDLLVIMQRAERNNKRRV